MGGEKSMEGRKKPLGVVAVIDGENGRHVVGASGRWSLVLFVLSRSLFVCT
jgi:hypothetical protein